MPNIATINGVAEDDIATYNGATASDVTSVRGATWVHWVGMVATGGSITTDGDYKVHTFNSDATFQVTTAGHGEVEYLVVAGGAGSGGPGGASLGAKEAKEAEKTVSPGVPGKAN